MKQVTVDILNNGDISFIEKPGTETLSQHGTTNRRRISRVEPCSFILRLLFYAIRLTVSDTSRLAAYTRSWRCKWRVRMLDSGLIFGRYNCRQAAIDAEVKHWNESGTFKVNHD